MRTACGLTRKAFAAIGTLTADTPEVERKRAAYIEARATTGMTVRQGIKILEGALAIGRQADLLGPDIVGARMNAARNEERAAASRAGRSLLSKLKSWFAAGKPQKTAKLAD